MKRSCRLFVCACAALLAGSTAQGWAGPFRQTNLVTDSTALVPDARFIDPNLVNPWGITFSGGSPFWVADNGSGRSTIYNGAGVAQPLVVTIPANTAAGNTTGSPTGIVANFGGFNFVFASEDGTISAWKGAFGTKAQVQVPGDAMNSNVFKGLATGANGSLLFATNFRTGNVDVFNKTFGSVKSFTDPSLTAMGFAPFGIQNIGGKLFVTFALQDADEHDDVAGPGNGFVDVFDTNGNLLQRLISHGPLDSPWGLALAPSGFGPFGGALLVGNFGNSEINAFDPNTGAFLGALTGADGNPLVLTVSPPGDPTNHKGLWGIIFGNGGPDGADPNTLFFTAGINDEGNGLFGSVTVVPEPGTSALFLLGLTTVGVGGWWRSRRRLRPSATVSPGGQPPG
jgi:uncharacterized protein (TIGR03118 family)